jgi:hypothetical protein
LISILAIGAIASAVVISMLLLGTAVGRTSLSMQQSESAAFLSEACAEYALRSLRANPSYNGNEVVGGFSVNGTCTILPIGGSGTSNRIICTEATVGNVVRRLEIVVQSLLPKTLIYSWQDVPSFSLCE